MTTREEEMERAVHMATLYGANEFATKATTLGEKVFWRAVREHALGEFRRLGGTVDLTNPHAHVLTLPAPPHIRFDVRDLDLMRAAVAAHDAQPKATQIGSQTTHSHLWEMATHDRADEAFEEAVRTKVWDAAAYAASVIMCSGCYATTKVRAQAFLALPATHRETFR